MELYYHLYLRRGVLFLPTTGRVEKGHYRNAEPVAVVPISNTEGAREALRATVARGNPPTPHYQPGNYPPSPILKYAGVKSWSIFARDAKTWSIHEENEIYQIVGYRKHAKGYWVGFRSEDRLSARNYSRCRDRAHDCDPRGSSKPGLITPVRALNELK